MTGDAYVDQMLPTYPQVVERRLRINRARLKAAVKAKSPLIGDISSHFVHEGGQSDIVRTDGSADTTKMKVQSAEIEIPRAKLDAFTEQDILKYLDELADQFAEGMTKGIIEAISEGAEKSGNVVDGKGSPLTPEMLLKVLDKIELDFKEDGSWDPPRMIVSPEQGAKLSELSKAMDARDYDAKVKKIVERKQLEYRRREAGRVLAG